MMRNRRKGKWMVSSMGKWVEGVGKAVGQVGCCVSRCHSIRTATSDFFGNLKKFKKVS